MPQIPIIKYELKPIKKSNLFDRVLIGIIILSFLIWLGSDIPIIEIVFLATIISVLTIFLFWLFSNEAKERVHVPIKIGRISLSDNLITIKDNNFKDPLDFPLDKIKSIQFFYSSVDYKKAPNLKHKDQKHIVLVINYGLSSHRYICPVHINGHNLFEEFKSRRIFPTFVDEVIDVE